MKIYTSYFGEPSVGGPSYTRPCVKANMNQSNQISRTRIARPSDNGTDVTWKYKAIYRLKDEQVSQWS